MDAQPVTPQKLDPACRVARLVVAAIALDREETAVVHRGQRAAQGQPVDVAGPELHLADCPARAAAAGVLGVDVDDSTGQRRNLRERFETVHH